ncbi:MAG: DUF2281 domain-containing protein [Chloroflexota bacterium]
MSENSLQEMIRALPPELQEEVRDFIAFLSSRQAKKRKVKMQFGWQGALKDLRTQYTSVELQHRISEMRMEQDETSS